MLAQDEDFAVFDADFHNHSCLSPCAELTMSPALIARTAREKGIGVIALTDHNASLNCPAFAAACAREGLIPLFGMELNSLEEAHLLAIFSNPRMALEFGSRIESLLPLIAWTAERFGDQPVVNSAERILDCYPKWLGSALDMSFDGLAMLARDSGAIVIPAHVDRAAFSVHSQLGFLPEGPYSAVEARGDPSPGLTRNFRVIRSSDAHAPDQIGCRRFKLRLPKALVESLKRSLESYCQRLGESVEELEGGSYADLLKSREVLLYPESESETLFNAVRKDLEIS